MSIKVTYYDGQSASRKTASLLLMLPNRLCIKLENAQNCFDLQQVEISERLGNTPRTFDFPDGSRAETSDNDAVDELLRNHKPNNTWLHKLESDWQNVILATFALIALLWAMIQFGVPVAAETIAKNLPEEVDQIISAQTMQILDEHILESSHLSESRQAEIQQGFDRLTASIPASHAFKLEFRRAPDIGPNAFALPSGTIVLLDELVEVAQNDNEIQSVLAHEIGHVVARHGLRLVLQDAALVLLLNAVMGDVLSSSTLASLFPVMLLESNYSREFEREADRFALEMMIQHKIPLRSFADILQRITGDNDASEGGLKNFLSSHPDTDERAKIFLNKID